MSNMVKLVGTSRSQEISCITLYLAEDTYLIVVLKKTLQPKNEGNDIDVLSAIHIPCKYFEK